MLKKGICFSLFLLGLFYFNPVSADLNNGDCSLEWPKNWEVTSMPQFRDDHDNSFGGKRFRAMLKDNEDLKVALEFTCIPLANRKLSLEGEFEAASKAIEAGYQKMGLEAQFSPATKNPLNQSSTLETEITVSAPEITLKQALLIAIDSQYLYSLSYTGVESEFQNNLKAYQEARASLAK